MCVYVCVYVCVCTCVCVYMCACVRSPFHHRVDWQMWFAAMQSYRHNPWLLHFVWKLLHHDATALSLIRTNPFAHTPPPHRIRLRLFRYRFTQWVWPRGLTWLPRALGFDESAHHTEKDPTAWYRRTFESEYLPPVSAEQLRPLIEHMQWPTTLS